MGFNDVTISPCTHLTTLQTVKTPLFSSVVSDNVVSMHAITLLTYNIKKEPYREYSENILENQTNLEVMENYYYYFFFIKTKI